jgi:hypothetical protein
MRWPWHVGAAEARLSRRPIGERREIADGQRVLLLRIGVADRSSSYQSRQWAGMLRTLEKLPRHDQRQIQRRIRKSSSFLLAFRHAGA